MSWALYNDEVNAAAHHNLLFIGPMGVGKTTIGRLVARRLGWQFHDTDEVVVDRCGVSIPTIFEIEGESGFRDRESAVLKELVSIPQQVLATGGGIVVRPENRGVLSQAGVVVYLHVAPELLYSRLRHDRTRPLLQVPNPLERIQALFTERDPLYRSVADMVVHSGQQSVTQLVSIVLNKLQDQFGFSHDTN